METMNAAVESILVEEANSEPAMEVVSTTPPVASTPAVPTPLEADEESPPVDDNEMESLQEKANEPEATTTYQVQKHFRP